MKKKLIEKLEEIAKDLPPVMEPKPTVISPQEAKKHYKKAKNHAYVVNTMQPVNHMTKLKKAYSSKGEAGVAAYQHWARETSKLQMNQKPKEVKVI